MSLCIRLFISDFDKNQEWKEHMTEIHDIVKEDLNRATQEGTHQSEKCSHTHTRASQCYLKINTYGVFK